MTQKALELLGFPLADPWPEVLPLVPGPLDGSTVDFGTQTMDAHAVRILLLQLEQDRRSKNFGGRFLILSRPWQKALDRDIRISSGHTVGLVGEEVIRYQPVIYTLPRARIQTVCDAGVFSELDADDVSAWSGEDLGLSAARFVTGQRN